MEKVCKEKPAKLETKATAERNECEREVKTQKLNEKSR